MILFVVPNQKISKFQVYGELTAQNGSSVTVKCTTFGLHSVKLKWLLGGIDITSKSKGSTVHQGNISSQIQVNFTSIEDVKSNYHCDKGQNFPLKCATNVTCLAERDYAAGETRDHLIEVFIGKR